MIQRLHFISCSPKTPKKAPAKTPKKTPAKKEAAAKTPKKTPAKTPKKASKPKTPAKTPKKADGSSTPKVQQKKTPAPKKPATDGPPTGVPLKVISAFTERASKATDYQFFIFCAGVVLFLILYEALNNYYACLPGIPLVPQILAFFSKISGWLGQGQNNDTTTAQEGG